MFQGDDVCISDRKFEATNRLQNGTMTCEHAKLILTEAWLHPEQLWMERTDFMQFMAAVIILQPQDASKPHS